MRKNSVYDGMTEKNRFMTPIIYFSLLLIFVTYNWHISAIMATNIFAFPRNYLVISTRQIVMEMSQNIWPRHFPMHSIFCLFSG